MKHIFWVHSHITFLVSDLVIKHLNIQPNDLIFITGRSYKIPEKSKEYLYSLIIDLNRLDEPELINFKEKFELYIPQTRLEGIKTILKIDNCIKYNIIEEGLLAYSYYELPPKILYYKILTYLGKKKRMRKLDYIHPKFKKAYCINKKAFKGLVYNKVVLSLNLKNDRNINNHYFNEKCNVIVFDGLVSYHDVTLTEILELLKIIIGFIRKTNTKKVFYKFHPVQVLEKNKKEVLEIKNIFLETLDIEFIELPQQVILEELIFKNNKVNIFNFVSSVGFYANLAGNKVYSVSDRLKQVKLPKYIKGKWQQI